MSRHGTPASLPLRDIHLPPAPAWWPPAPGWWWLGAVVVLLLALVLARHWRRRRRRRALARMFDDAVARAPTAAARVGAMSELLRRAARRIDPAAATLAGEDWLRFLDRGRRDPVFRNGAGALLGDGAFRNEVDAREVDALRAVARARFLEWMAR